MNFEIVPAFAIPLEEQARVANEAFAGYVGGWAEMDAAGLARFLQLQGADLFHSRFIRTPAALVGFAYITRTADILRLSGMGIIPFARGRGAAACLLEHLFEEARANGDVAMMLEVIEQNPRAHSLYLRHEFREISRLLGWRLQSGAHRNTDAETRLEPIPLIDALSMQVAHDYPNIPWQISRHALAKVPNLSAFRIGGACVFIGDHGAAPVRIYGLYSSLDKWAELRTTLLAVTARFPDREFFAPPLWPEEFGANLFAPLGFAREPITQVLMRRDFRA